jgi:hypothetical protein
MFATLATHIARNCCLGVAAAGVHTAAWTAAEGTNRTPATSAAAIDNLKSLMEGKFQCPNIRAQWVFSDSLTFVIVPT